MKKEDKAFNDDAELDAVCKVFIVDRLKFEDELEWPLLRDISDPAPPPSSEVNTAHQKFWVHWTHNLRVQHPVFCDSDNGKKHIPHPQAASHETI